MGINLVPEQVDILLKFFDKDGSGQIDLQEFMTAIRVSTILNCFFLKISFIFKRVT